MATANPSLFGMLGDEEAMQRQLDEQRAKAFAEQTQEQRLASMGYKAGSQLGRGIAGAFGVDVTDPVIRQASQLRQMASQFDTTTPEGLMQYAQAIRSVNPDLAMQAAAKAQTMRVEADKPLQELIKAGKYTPESIKAFSVSRDVADLKLMDKEDKKSDLAILLAERAQLDPVKNKEQYDLYNAKIKKLVSGKGLAGDIAEGLAPMVAAIAEGQAKKSGEAGGAAVGKDVAAIQGKYTALGSVNDALDVVERGIYAGGYGPLGEAVAKYSSGAVGSKQRLVNTEEFRAYIGDVVIPRLQEFGGNDSVEELKYLRSVMAGETTLEEKSIKRILQNAGKKIRSGIQRLEAQQKAIQKGEPLPTSQLGAKQYTTKSGVTYTKED